MSVLLHCEKSDAIVLAGLGLVYKEPILLYMDISMGAPVSFHGSHRKNFSPVHKLCSTDKDPSMCV